MRYLHVNKISIDAYPKIKKKFEKKGVVFFKNVSIKDFIKSRGFGSLGQTRIKSKEEKE